MQPVISPFTIYIIEHLHSAMSGLSVLCGVIMIGCIMAYAISKTDTEERARDYVDNIMSKIANETRIKSCKDEDFINRVNKMMEYGESYIGKEDEAKKYRKKLFIASCFCLFIIVLNLFIPTRDTMYRMLVASYVTPENLDLGVNFTKETFEYFLNQIIEAINKLK